MNLNDKKQAFLSVKNLTIVPVSVWLDKVDKKSFLKGCRRQFIHNGIDVNLFCPQVNNLSIKHKYIIQGKFMLLGVAADWNERKELSDFKKLYEKLKSSSETWAMESSDSNSLLYFACWEFSS